MFWVYIEINIRITFLMMFFLFFHRRTTTLNQKVPNRLANLPTCCPQSSPCTACPLSPLRPTWARQAPSRYQSSRAMAGRPATPWPRPSASPRCSHPAWVPLPPHPSRSAHLCTPMLSSPWTRALYSISQFACSSRSQSSRTKWGSRHLCILLLLANRLVTLCSFSSHKWSIWSKLHQIKKILKNKCLFTQVISCFFTKTNVTFLSEGFKRFF